MAEDSIAAVLEKVICWHNDSLHLKISFSHCCSPYIMLDPNWISICQGYAKDLSLIRIMIELSRICSGYILDLYGMPSHD